MNSCNKKDSSPSDTKFTAELLPKTPTSKQTTHSLTTQSTTQKQKITPTARINSPNTQLCKGTSVSTGRPCKRTVLSDNFCYHHKDQITGKNMFGVPTTPKKNNLPKNETDYSDEVIDLTNDMAPSHSQNGRREKLVGIENQLNSLSLNNSKKDRLAQDDSKIKNSEASSTVITINLNKLKVQITEELELSKKSTQVSISSEDNNSNRDQTPPPIRSDIDRAEFTQKKSLSSSTKWVQTDVNNQLPPQDRLPIESPACVDDSFLETTNKELFQTPTLVTPSSELFLAPLLSISPSQPKSPLDSLFDSGRIKPEEELKSSSHPKIVHTPDLKPPSTPTPTKTRMISYTSYESHVSITGNQNVTPGSITPTRSRQIDLTTPTHSRNPIDLTGDYYNTSPYNSPSNLCQGRIKNGKICNRRTKPSEEFCHQHRKEFIEPAEELEKAVFVPGRARLTYLRFGEWIKPDLLPETKNSLRSEMEKPISESDEPGFIYAYRLLEGPNSEKNSQYTLYKVGRTTNVHRRLYQWAKQCGYRPELIEMFPNVDISFSSFDKEEGECSSDSKSEISKCKYTHRAERLIHIELGARFKADIEKCKNCGNIHREWFKVTSSDSSNSTNVMHGWDEVRKIIVHWISYVEKVYGVG